MDLTELSKEIYLGNKEKGFWDEERNIGEILMLIVSELGEAMEALRNGRHSKKRSLISCDRPVLNASSIEKECFKYNFEELIKDTFQDEMADILIRLLDLCGGLDIDIQKYVELKLTYNKLRPYKHGKTF